MFDFSQRQNRVLHLTWIAFFLTFVSWFNMAPFNTTLMRVVGLSPAQVDILMICNVALTVPARIFIGFLVDRHGPRKIFSTLLAFASLVCFQFSLASTFEELMISRLLMGIVGAGFVVGIKMIAEWFPPEKMGRAQGIYAGWGNFGAAAAAFALPLIAHPFSDETGWRVAIAVSGVLCLIWAAVYFKYSADFPEDAVKFKVDLREALEVTSRKDLLLLTLMLIPIYGAVAAFFWKLAGNPLPLLSENTFNILCAGLILIYAWHVLKCVRYNLSRLEHSEHPYRFSQITILSLIYALTFGSELAMVSIFPQFLETSFGLSVALAGVLGSSFAFMNLVTRPAGGWCSDFFGRRRMLVILVLGAMICYRVMGGITPQWSLWQVLALALACSVFLQAGNGACFAAVPLIRKDLTGKMAGMAGAYGNVGAVVFLTLHSFMNTQEFFQAISAYALIVLISLGFLKSFNKEPHSR